jgi:putative addiction module CopG family antidote
MSFALPEAMRSYIDARVLSGQYGNTSEYIRDLIRKDQEEQARHHLRSLIEEGLASGPAQARPPHDRDDLRALATRDRQAEVRYCRDEAGSRVAETLVLATEHALDQLERQPGLGSPILGKQLGIEALRTWRVTGFPLLWFYVERDDHLDVIRLLGERQDVLALLSGRGGSSAHEPEAAYSLPR